MLVSGIESILLEALIVKKMFTVVVHVSSPPRKIMGSIISNVKYVKDVYIVYPEYDGKPLYQGWNEDLEALKNANVAYYFSASIVVKEFKDSSIVVEVSSDSELKLGAFETIHQEMSRANEAQTHFALSPDMDCGAGFSPLHGFLVIMLTIDWFWNRIFERNKLIQSYDVQARFILKKGKRVFLPERSFIWRFWNSSVIPKVRTHSAVTHVGDDVLQLLGTHAHQRIGLWLFPYLAVYLVLTFSWSTMILYQQMLPYAIGIWVAEIAVSFMICNGRMRTANNRLYFVLFPIYWVMYPFFLIHARFR